VWNSVVPQVISGNVLVANSTPGTAIQTATIMKSLIIGQKFIATGLSSSSMN
jgi:hypothetical protein